ncbi:MAG: choice-of-anchor D domain-containing protein [Verrucomicrobia bacterium]|nr:choice-of-anchor D domain-containing protein [Verrucomicrobiota bacterium]
MRTTTTFALILTAGLALATPAGAAIVSYWSFDSDASDATGAHDGTLVGGAAISTGGLGFGGGEALTLAVDGDYVDLASPTTFDFNSDFTWHARIKTADGSGAIFSRNPDATAWNQGSKALFVRGNNVTWDTGWVGAPGTGTAVNDDVWHTVIATYDSTTDLLNIFVDPIAGATTGQYSGTHDVNRFDEHTLEHNLGFAETSFTIGRADFSGGLANLDTLTGLIDDAAVFDTALAGAELDQLITQGPGSFLEVDGDPSLLAPVAVLLDDTGLPAGAVSRSVGISNSGAAEMLTISGVTFSGPDAAQFTAPSFPATLDPGEDGSIGFTFTPIPDTPRSYSATMAIASNAEGVPTTSVTLQIDAVNDPRLEAPASVTIPAISLPGTPSTIGMIPISNSGIDETLDISGVSFGGDDPGLFSNPVFPATLAPGAAGAIDFDFTPTGPGTFSAIAQIASDSQGSAVTEVLLQITVAQVSDLPGGLIAYWPFDQDARDVTGNHDGILVGTAAITTGALGFSGEALQLTAEGDYVDVSAANVLDFNSDFTWHARIKTADNSGAIFSRNPDGTAWNQGSKALFVRGSNVDWDTGWVGNPKTNVAVDDDAWHTVIATYDATTDLLNIFVDPAAGATAGQFSAAHDVNRFDEHTLVHNGGIADTSFTIGRADFSGGLASLDTLTGLIDDAALFDRALSGDDLDQLITSGPASFFEDPDTLRFISISYDLASQVATFSWVSLPEHRYFVESSSDLKNWIELDDSYPSEGESTSFMESDVLPGVGRRYYRVTDLGR